MKLNESGIDETKKKYEDEVHRLQEISKQMEQQYKERYEALKEQETALINEYNAQMQQLNIGIERLRGAYTALVDLEEGKLPTLVENGMLKGVTLDSDGMSVEVEENTEAVIETENVSNTETAQEEVKEEQPQVESKEVSKPEISEDTKTKAKELVKEAKQKGKVTPYEEFAKSDLGKETALTDEELEALKTVTESTEAKDTPKEDVKNDSNVKEEDIPDYLKEEYGIKK